MIFVVLLKSSFEREEGRRIMIERENEGENDNRER